MNQLVSAVMNVYDGGTRCSSTFNTTASSIQRTLQTLSFMSKEHFVKQIYKCRIIQLSRWVCCVLLHITFCPSESLVHRQIWLLTPQEHFARDLIQADPKHHFCEKRFNTRSFNFLDGFSWGVEAEKPAVAIPVFPALPISGTV